jgi:cell division transport system ATP-binding protein
MGIIFQDFRLLQRKTVFDNVAVTLKVIGLSEGLLRRKVFEALRLVGLDRFPNALPSALSAGEQQRVCLARAIVNDPLILLADEPTSNLDAALSVEILNLLKAVNLRGTTVVVATHNPNLVGRLKRRMIVLQHGRVMEPSKAAEA